MSIIRYGNLRIDQHGEGVNGHTYNSWLNSSDTEEKIRAEVDPAIAKEKEVDLIGGAFVNNGTYTAPDGQAYKTVSVAVSESQLTDLDVTENGIYEGRFKKVNVNVPTPTGTSLVATSLGTYEPVPGTMYNHVAIQGRDGETITENGQLSGLYQNPYIQVDVKEPKITYHAEDMSLEFEDIEMEVV